MSVYLPPTKNLSTFNNTYYNYQDEDVSYSDCVTLNNNQIITSQKTFTQTLIEDGGIVVQGSITDASNVTAQNLIFTGTLNNTITPTQLNYLENINQNIQTALTNLQANTADITCTSGNTTVSGTVYFTGNASYNSYLPTSSITSCTAGNQFATIACIQNYPFTFIPAQYFTALPVSNYTSTYNANNFLTKQLNDALYASLNSANTFNGAITLSSGNNLTLTYGTVNATNAVLSNNLTVSGTITTYNLVVNNTDTDSASITTNSLLATYYNGLPASSFPTVSPNNGATGFQSYWNVNTGTGDTSLVSLGQGGSGGWQFYGLNTSSTNAPVKLFSVYPSGFTIPPSTPLNCGSLYCTSGCIYVNTDTAGSVCLSMTNKQNSGYSTFLTSGSSSQNFNNIVQTGDSGIFWGQSSSYGFVIAPWASQTSGSRWDCSGNLTQDGTLNVSGITTCTTSTGSTINVYNTGTNGTLLNFFANTNKTTGDFIACQNRVNTGYSMYFFAGCTAANYNNITQTGDYGISYATNSAYGYVICPNATGPSGARWDYNGNLTQDGTLTVSGATTISSSLTVSNGGSTTLSGQLNCNDTYGSTGSGAINIVGQSTSASAVYISAGSRGSSTMNYYAGANVGSFNNPIVGNIGGNRENGITYSSVSGYSFNIHPNYSSAQTSASGMKLDYQGNLYEYGNFIYTGQMQNSVTVSTASTNTLAMPLPKFLYLSRQSTGTQSVQLPNVYGYDGLEIYIIQTYNINNILTISAYSGYTIYLINSFSSSTSISVNYSSATTTLFHFTCQGGNWYQLN